MAQTKIRTEQLSIERPYFLATMSSDQLNIVNQTVTTVQYNNEVSDTHGGYNPSTYIYTIPTGYTGIWSFEACLVTNMTNDKTCRVDITITGKEGAATWGNGGNYGANGLSLNLTRYCEEGDTIRVTFWHNEGSNTPDVLGSTWGTSRNNFKGNFIGKA